MLEERLPHRGQVPLQTSTAVGIRSQRAQGGDDEIKRALEHRPGRHHLGGLVQPGSVSRAADGLAVQFVVTDGPASVTVSYDGILPDLFQEGQGVIARGAFGADRRFTATEVLAKHDENYMPPEVADALNAAHEAGKTGMPTTY